MLKHTAVIALAGVLALGLITLGVAGKPSTTTSGSWQVDSQLSSAQLVTDGTTNFGKTKINFTVGFTRVNGGLKLDEADPANSKFDFRMYPASSMAPPIGEDGKVKASWLANAANNTLVCFHSKKVVRTPDGKLQATGDLTLTRVDRNLQYNPTEDYSGPVYGPPIIHRVSREATFVFDLTPPGENGQKTAAITASGSTSISREGFPQLVRAVVSTDWPPVVMDENCQNPAGGTEDYRGFRCTGTFMEASGLPPAPTQLGEDYPGASDFNAVVGNQLTILVHLRLAPQA
ncbi:MAG: YceI family protein [Candidatus Korobacteraceae bacterium]